MTRTWPWKWVHLSPILFRVNTIAARWLTRKCVWSIKCIMKSLNIFGICGTKVNFVFIFNSMLLLIMMCADLAFFLLLSPLLIFLSVACSLEDSFTFKHVAIQFFSTSYSVHLDAMHFAFGKISFQFILFFYVHRVSSAKNYFIVLLTLV